MSGYIDSIEQGDPTPWTINVIGNNATVYNGKSVTATQGETKITGTFTNEKAVMKVPKAGTWNITTDVSGSSNATVSFVSEQTANVSVQCTATLNVKFVQNVNNQMVNAKLYLSSSYTTSKKSGTGFNINWYIPQGTTYTSSSNRIYYESSITLSYSFKDFGLYYIVFQAEPYTGNYTGSMVIPVNVTENKMYTYEYNFTAVSDKYYRDPPIIDPPEIFGDYPLSSPEEPTLEYLTSLGKSEEEAEQTLSAWQAERQKYVELEQTGLEEAEIMAKLYQTDEE